jgi:molecular chaperone HscB
MPDAFDLLGIEPQFTIDAAEVERRHRALLAKLHPDRSSVPVPVSEPDLSLNPAPVPQPDAREAREASLARLGDINNAYRIITDPILRAEQLLARLGVAPQSKAEPELLTRIFEQRQAVDDATHAGDVECLSNIAAAARARQSALIDELAAFFEIEQACVSVPQETQIARVLDELRYLKKLVERAELALDELL